MQRHETLVSSHSGALKHEFCHAFHTQAEGQVDVSNSNSLFPLFSAVLPALRKPELRHFRFVVPCFRQANCKTSAPIVTILSPQRPAMVLNDATGNREPHSGPVGFC